VSALAAARVSYQELSCQCVVNA